MIAIRRGELYETTVRTAELFGLVHGWGPGLQCGACRANTGSHLGLCSEMLRLEEIRVQSLALKVQDDCARKVVLVQAGWASYRLTVKGCFVFPMKKPALQGAWLSP